MPTSRGNNQDEPQSGTNPMRAKACRNDADRAAIRISPVNARLMPAPAAMPLIAVTIGIGRARRRMNIGLYQDSRSLLALPSASAARSRVGRSGSFRLAPEQKARPAPVITRHRAELASTRSIAIAMSSRSFRPKAFSTLGSFSVMTATSPVVSRIILPCFIVPFPGRLVIWSR